MQQAYRLGDGSEENVISEFFYVPTNDQGNQGQRHWQTRHSDGTTEFFPFDVRQAWHTWTCDDGNDVPLRKAETSKTILCPTWSSKALFSVNEMPKEFLLIPVAVGLKHLDPDCRTTWCPKYPRFNTLIWMNREKFTHWNYPPRSGWAIVDHPFPLTATYGYFDGVEMAEKMNYTLMILLSGK